jgi:uncharacterized membrane protein
MAQRAIWLYIQTMRSKEPQNRTTKNQMTVAGSLIIIVALLAFAGWLSSGKQMMASLIQSGLAWCF